MSNPTYGKIIAPSTYSRLMEQHVHIGESDEFIKTIVSRLAANTPALRVFEAGCGPARLTRKLATLVPSINLTGIDHDASFIDAGRKVLEGTGKHVELIHADISEYEGSPADVVISQGMHHHIPKAAVPGYLQTVWDILKPGGIYIISDEFLASYQGEEDRKIVAILWYCHVIGSALVAGHQELAVEEAKTLLDDLAMGEDNPKTAKQIDAVLEKSSAINCIVRSGYILAARMLAEKLLLEVKSFGSNERCGDDRLDLSRGDFKVDGKIFRTEMNAAGFTIEAVRWFGPIDVAGAMGVFTLRKAI